LKLAQEQVRKICDIIGEVDARGKAEGAPVKPAEPGDRDKTANKLVLKKHQALQMALPEILTKAQALRMRQLERQAAGMSAFQDPENEKLLALTDEQRGKVRTIIVQAREFPLVPDGRAISTDEAAVQFLEAQAREFRPLLQDGKIVPSNYKKTEKAAVQQILELLSQDQKRTWRDLTGDTCDVGSLQRADLFPAPNGFPPIRIREPFRPRPIIDAGDGHAR
jgi:hypothetical protein